MAYLFIYGVIFLKYFYFLFWRFQFSTWENKKEIIWSKKNKKYEDYEFLCLSVQAFTSLFTSVFFPLNFAKQYINKYLNNWIK